MKYASAAVSVMWLALHSPRTSAASPPPPLTAAAVADAPLPGEEHGRVDPLDPGDGIARRIARAVLWIPRLPVELVMQPVRGVLYLQARRHAGELAEGDENPERVLGLRPRFIWQTGFNPHVSLRVALRNVLGEGEEAGIRVGYGGHLGGVIAADLNSGRRFGRVQVGVEARYDHRDDERFFGFGNGDGAGLPAMPIDPLTDDTAVATRYELRGRRVTPYVRVRPVRDVAVIARGDVIRKRFTPSDDPRSGDVSLERGFLADRVPGFVDGTAFARGELELVYDTRRAAHELDPPAIHSTGVLLLGHVARFQDLRGNADFYRYGFDLQQDIRLTAGPRAVELRLAGDFVTGDLEEIPFTEVPALGGDLMRASSIDRYRDRVALIARASYLFALGPRAAAVLFSEAGRVYRDPRDVTLDGLRYGFGLGLEGYSVEELLFRAEIAASLDGGVFFTLAFVPVQDGRSRVRD